MPHQAASGPIVQAGSGLAVKRVHLLVGERGIGKPVAQSNTPALDSKVRSPVAGDADEYKGLISASVSGSYGAQRQSAQILGQRRAAGLPCHGHDAPWARKTCATLSIMRWLPAPSMPSKVMKRLWLMVDCGRAPAGG